MRRTQLYLDDALWNILHARAKSESKTVSELVRETVRERYLGDLEKRRQAMLAFIGSRKDPPDAQDSTEYIRELRQDDRLERLLKK